MDWFKKEVGVGLEYIIHNCRDYPYEYHIFIKEYPAGSYKVIWNLLNFKNKRKMSRIQRYYTSRDYKKNKANAEYLTNLLKIKLVNENPLKYEKKLLLNNLRWI